MKLFVWETPYDVRYGDSRCYAVAETVEEARAIAIRREHMDCYTKPPSDITLGEPSAVFDVPVAIWYAWEE